MVNVKTDMTGWNMWEHGVAESRLTVIKQVDDYVLPNGKGRYSRWLCECSCENHPNLYALGNNLKSGNTLSCGCLNKEKMGEVGGQNHKTNIYDLSGEYGVGYCSNTGNEFYFDLEDYDKIKDFYWREQASGNSYAQLVACKPNENKNIKMHILLGFKNHDHINRNPLDNRKENLRPCTYSQHTMNRKKLSNNTSGFIGVEWRKDNNKWRANININKKKKSLGCFVNKKDAIVARLTAEAKYYGEFAPQRHLFSEYNINIGEKYEEYI